MMYWAYKDLIDTEDQEKHDPFNSANLSMICNSLQ